MDDAYMELYREFLRLRSLCLKQAALLQQLSTALQITQGSVADGGGSEMVSIPVLYSQLLRREQQPPPPQGSRHACGGAGTFTNTVTEDMGKLCLDVAHLREGDGAVKHNPSPSSALHVMDSPLQSSRIPWEFNPFLDSDSLSHIFMSQPALQSNVCEFCQAVFPGDTTTRGEFIKHLHTHIP